MTNGTNTSLSVQRQSFQLCLLRQEFQLDKLPMVKRVQEQKEEGRIVAKSRLTAMNLFSSVPASSSSAKNLITSPDPVKLIAAVKLATRTEKNFET